MKKVFDKYPILKYVVSAYIKYFLIFSIIAVLLFALLKVTGIYEKLESALNINYNSPIIVGPLFLFVIAAGLSFLVGVLLYFHKYKRPKKKGKFYEAFSKTLIAKQK